MLRVSPEIEICISVHAAAQHSLIPIGQHEDSEHEQHDERQDGAREQAPQQRVGECEEDIGRFVALLCSDASSYVNGQSIAVDGGQAFMG